MINPSYIFTRINDFYRTSEGNRIDIYIER